MANFTTPSGAVVNDSGQTLSGPTSSSPSTSSLLGTTALSGASLNNSLNSSFDSSNTASTIMDAYRAQLSANTAGTESANKYAAGLESSAEDTQNYEKSISLQDATTASKGLINPGAMSVIQNRSDKIIADLKTNLADAMANNNASLVKANSDAMATEISNMTAARTSFLSNYFATQQESRAQATFQTPEQQQVLALSGQYPNAGITTADTLASAEAKVTGSAQYKLGQSAIQSGINLQGAQASQAAQAAAQTKIINGFMQGDTAQFKPDVDGLLSGSVTDQTLHAKYDSFPGGVGGAIIANIEKQAQAAGWSPQSSKLKSDAQISQNNALNSGNPFTLLGAGLTQGLGALSNVFSGPGSAFSTVSTAKTPTSGTTSTGLTWKITP